ncbi:hypothetical protein C0J52_14594 [Blattella germanica]|nr:hypothetical protein C0J52_14594 [Blattella germanica]
MQFKKIAPPAITPAATSSPLVLCGCKNCGSPQGRDRPSFDLKMVITDEERKKSDFHVGVFQLPQDLKSNKHKNSKLCGIDIRRGPEKKLALKVNYCRR